MKTPTALTFEKHCSEKWRHDCVVISGYEPSSEKFKYGSQKSIIICFSWQDVEYGNIYVGRVIIITFPNDY